MTAQVMTAQVKSWLARALLAMVLAVGVALPVAGPAWTPAWAADAYLAVNSAGAGQHVRLGLNKSLVVDLPTDARDVLVSNPAIADAVMRTSRRAYLIGMEIGQTNVFFFDAAGNQIANLEVQVERDLAALSAMLRQHIPGSSIQVDAVNDNIVLAGSARTPIDAERAADIASRFIGDPEKVLNTIAVDGNEQVHLKVTVAEIQRNVLKQFGIDFSASLASGAFSAGILTDNPFSVNTPISGTAFQGGWTDGVNSVNARLRSMEQAGIVKILAEPTLSAISGESATFLAGGEFPIPVGFDQDTDTVIIEFKEFGVSLSFTPVVLAEERISLKVATEVSEVTEENAITTGLVTIPGISVRRADTTMELPSGGSMVMAGLIQQNQRQIINKVPGAGDIPVLGTLFRSRDFINQDTELVVIVTPYMAKPVAEREIGRPDQNLEMASDPSTILLGRLNRIYGVAGSEPRGRYTGQFGFIIE